MVEAIISTRGRDKTERDIPAEHDSQLSPTNFRWWLKVDRNSHTVPNLMGDWHASTANCSTCNCSEMLLTSHCSCCTTVEPGYKDTLWTGLYYGLVSPIRLLQAASSSQYRSAPTYTQCKQAGHSSPSCRKTQCYRCKYPKNRKRLRDAALSLDRPGSNLANECG